MQPLPNPKISFHLIPANENFQVVHFTLEGNGTIEPADLSQLRLQEVDYSKGVIISGRGPMWLYAYLVHAYHPAAWVAVFDPRIGAVVVQNHIPTGPSPGSTIPMEKIKPLLELIHRNTFGASPKSPQPESGTTHTAAIIAIVGPPHSGKSVFLYALQEALHHQLGSIAYQHQVFTVRACPDGEGNWFQEVAPDTALTIRRKSNFDDEFVARIVRAIQNVRLTKKILLIDCGGKIDRCNQSIWNECTHAIIVVHDPAELDEWKGACKASELHILAEVISSPQPTSRVVSQNPLRVEVGPLERQRLDVRLPQELIHEIDHSVPQ